MDYYVFLLGFYLIIVFYVYRLTIKYGNYLTDTKKNNSLNTLNTNDVMSIV